MQRNCPEDDLICNITYILICNITYVLKKLAFLKVLLKVNPFHASAFFLYPLKITENLSFSDVFRRHRKREYTRNRLITEIKLESIKGLKVLAGLTVSIIQCKGFSVPWIKCLWKIRLNRVVVAVSKIFSETTDVATIEPFLGWEVYEWNQILRGSQMQK